MIGQKQVNKALQNKGTSQLLKLINNGLDISGNGNITKTILNGIDNKFIKIFIKHSSNIDFYEELDFTALVFACKKNNIDIVKYLIKYNADVNLGCGFMNTHTPLASALSNKHFEVAKYLIENGADTTLNNSIGWKALVKSINKQDCEVSKLLVAHQADIEGCDMSYNALLYATEQEDIKLVSTLLEYGLDVNFPGNGGATALHIAVIKNNDEIVKTLIKNGANINQIMIDNTTPLMLSVNFTLNENNLLDKKLAIAKILIDNNADVNSYNSKGFTALMIACKNYQSTKVIELLLENAASVNHKCKKSLTALMCASMENNIIVTKILLEYEINIEEKSQEGTTALMLASYFDNVEIVKILLENGSDKLTKDNKSFTALDYAQSNIKNKIIYLLSEDNKKISTNISIDDCNHGIIDDKDFEKLINSNIQHEPKKLIELLDKFTSKEPLKSTTHAVINNSEYLEFIKTVSEEFTILSEEYANNINQVIDEKDAIGQSIELMKSFLVTENFTNISYGISNMKIGWSSSELKAWSEEHPNESINDFPLPNTKEEQTFQNTIDLFKNEIELRPNGNDLNTLLFDILNKELNGFSISISEDSEEILEETKCFINTKLLKNGLRLIVKEIEEKSDASHKNIKIIAKKTHKYIEVKITHIGSNSKMSSEDIQARIDSGKGSFNYMKKEFLSLCDLSIESSYKDNYFKIDLLNSYKEEELDNSKTSLDFTYILRIFIK